MNAPSESRSVDRRRFLRTSAGSIATVGLWLAGSDSPAGTDQEPITFGLVTDVHYADIRPAGTRHYRDSLAKLRQAIETFNRRQLPLAIELGDFVDAGPSKEDDLQYLAAAEKIYAEFQGDRHYVLGNHCVTRLSKAEFLAQCKSDQAEPHYSFDRGGYHFVVLDANFKEDGSPYLAGNFDWIDTWIPKPQQEWLAEDLGRAADKKVFVFIHQNLDKEHDPHGVKNAPEVRQILENSGNVAAVFQGHMHTGDHQKIGGIHYVTLRAMVEKPTLQNNAYAIVSVDGHGRITLEGLGKQRPLVLD